MQKIKSEFGDSSTVLMRKFLDKFIEDSKDLNPENFKAQGFTYLGRTLNAYTWACISKIDQDTGKQDYRNNPQLFIVMQEEAIRFGFSYGDGDIKDEFNSVITIKSNDDALENIIELQKDGW